MNAPVPLVLGVVYTGLFGAIVGSYLNVVVHRLPRGLSTWRPRSRCPGCGTTIAWFDNVPVMSWLLLRGRCRSCGIPISWRYPLVEATTAALFAGCYARYQWSATTLVALVLVSLLVSLALIDAEHFLLPDAITLPGLVVGLLVSPWSELTTPLSAGLGALLGAGFLLSVIVLYYLLRGEYGMGLGDPKMLAMIGAFLGVPGTILAVFVASAVGSLWSVMLILARRAGRRTRMPFGVALAFGGLLSLFAGQELVLWYLDGWT